MNFEVDNNDIVIINNSTQDKDKRPYYKKTYNKK